ARGGGVGARLVRALAGYVSWTGAHEARPYKKPGTIP
ncbi:MAG: hypothetical protein QG602_3245, partial [Verrucomicrobiota bacterium]|nr:hypothetical protein [Verrucomicrobiota bacterium]